MRVLLLLFAATSTLACGASGDSPAAGGQPDRLVIDYPADGSVFPPDFTVPTILWHDPEPERKTWTITVEFGDGAAPIRLTSDGPSAFAGEVDPDAIGTANSLHEGTPYQRSTRSWTPNPALWAEMKRRSVKSSATLTITGAAGVPESTASIRFSTSTDPVGAPLFYRDVPLMPAVGETGIIAPLDVKALPRVAWRLRDLSQPESKVVLTGMPSCANCHSFSQDGSTLGMDVDGPGGDKGMYALAPLADTTVIDAGNTITWNSFPDKPEGHRTIGFLSRLSPKGDFAITTLNEALYVNNFTDFRFLQVFYPTRGILAWYSKDSGEMKALPGADDTEYVHCGADWFPGGEEIVFMRAPAIDPDPPGRPRPKYAGDPNELPLRFDLYRMPFKGGRGGTPVPVKGASNNGMSNTFPKVSPDGKWIVYTKCANGMLIRPDSRLWIVPAEGGEAREMRCNLPVMNSWHSFSPNGRWMVFSSKSNTPYTQLFLTHIDEDGNDTPAILIPRSTAPNRAANIPEFVNRPYNTMNAIDVPVVEHHRFLQTGLALSAEGRWEEAVPQFEKSLAAQPDFTRALGHLGRALVELGRLEEAREHLNRALTLEPDSAFVHLVLGVSWHRAGEIDRAERLMKRSLELNPREPLAHYNLAILLMEKDALPAALASAREAALLDPADPDIRNLYGWLLQRTGKMDDAAVEYRAVLEIKPGHRLAEENLLTVLRARGHTAEMVAHLKTMVKSRPDETMLRLNLAWELATRPEESLRDGKEAVRLAENCRKSLGDRVDVLDVLAAAYAEAGRWSDATKAAKEALTLSKAGAASPAPGLEDRLALYLAGRPFRQP